MHVKNVSLNDVFVPLGVAGVVSSVNEPNIVDVKGSIGEDFQLLFGQLSQVESVTSPDDRWSRRSRHVALDLNVVADSGRDLIQFQGFIQRHHRYT